MTYIILPILYHYSQFKYSGELINSGEFGTYLKALINFKNPYKTLNSENDLSGDDLTEFKSLMKIRENGLSDYSMAEIKAKSELLGFNDSLKTEMTALAKDADLSAKAATGKLTFAEALKDGKISTNELGDALGKYLTDNGENLKNWFIVDAALYFYLFTLRYTMIDNRSKNTFWHWAKHYISTKEATELGDNAKYYTIDDEAAKINNGYRIDLWNYDNDSAEGINNSGELTMTYGKEDTDYRTDGDKSSGYIFNAAESVFFCRVRDLMKSQLRTMYASCESKNCWSAQSLINEFDSKQNEWCEELWRLDYERKYERTYRDGNTRFLEQMMNGKKKYQRRQFERDQEMYMATKFIGTTATSDQIMFRCNTPASAVVNPDYTLHLTPYSDMYLSVMFGNSSPTQIRAKAGKSYDIPCPYTTMDDTAVLIYGASKIQSMGDISTAYIHDNDFSKAAKLKELIIGNITEGYTNTFLTNLVIGNNKLLEKLDIRNTPNWTKVITVRYTKTTD